MLGVLSLYITFQIGSCLDRMTAPFPSPKTIQLLCYNRKSIFKLYNFGVSNF